MMLIMYLGATMPSIPPGVPLGSRSDCQIPERSARPSGVARRGARQDRVCHRQCAAALWSGHSPTDRQSVQRALQVRRGQRRALQGRSWIGAHGYGAWLEAASSR